jgi:flagellar basal-body rod protein FlgB
MDLTKLPLFALATKRMGWLARRQEVLSQNVANSDSPGYQPRDLKAQDFRAVLAGTSASTAIGMARTADGHLNGLRHAAAWRDGKMRDPFEEAPSGNAVVLEEQMMKVSETQTDYRMATTLYRRHVAMLKEALGRRGG